MRFTGIFTDFWERFKDRNRRCGTCRSDGIHGSLIGRFPTLKYVEALKFGQLYRCVNCGSSWFLHEHKQWLNRIHDDCLPLVHRWNQSPLTADSSILAGLARIGGVQGFYKDQITIPCAAHAASGEYHEKGVVLVSKHPPFRRPEPRLVHWADELTAVAPSPFALSLSVRRASSEKVEEAMGFAPTGVVDGTGTEDTVLRDSQFFDWKGVKGPDLRLSHRQKGWRNVVSPQPAQAYYFIDWFDQCDTLLCSYSAS